jgi:hypothetical protein
MIGILVAMTIGLPPPYSGDMTNPDLSPYGYSQCTVWSPDHLDHYLCDLSNNGLTVFARCDLPSLR